MHCTGKAGHDMSWQTIDGLMVDVNISHHAAQSVPFWGEKGEKPRKLLLQGALGGS